jgi:hypothetical protein
MTDAWIQKVGVATLVSLALVLMSVGLVLYG